MVKKIATFLAGAIAAVLLGELILRPWPPKLESSWVFNLPSRWVLDDVIIFNKPRLRKANTYSISDNGKPLLFSLGDSFTAGYPVEQNESYPAKLGRLLQQAGAPASIVNIGLGDSGPDQQLVLLQRYALAHAHPKVVIWQFCANDLWDSFTKALFIVEAGKLKPFPATENWLYRRHVIFDRIPLPFTLKKNSRLVQYFLAAIQPPTWRGFKRPYGSYSHEWALAKVRLELQQMHLLEKEFGFRLYVVLVAPQLLYLDISNATLDFFGTSYEELYKLLSSDPGFILIYFNQPGDPPWHELFVGSDRDSNYLGERHFNERGYALMARRISDHLLSDQDFRRVVKAGNP